MSIFTNKETKNFVVRITAVLIILVCVFLALAMRRGTTSNTGWCKAANGGLGHLLIAYAYDNGGVLPPPGWDSKNGRPKWVQTLYEWRKRQGHDDVLYNLKCHSDRTHDVSSYELNPELAGKALKSVPESKWSTTILLFEKDFPGSHRSICYLDGQVTSRIQSPR